MIVLNFENINYNNTLELNDQGGINIFNISNFYVFKSIFYLSPLNIYDVKNTYQLITTKNDNNITHFTIHDRNDHHSICMQGHFCA